MIILKTRLSDYINQIRNELSSFVQARRIKILSNRILLINSKYFFSSFAVNLLTEICQTFKRLWYPNSNYLLQLLTIEEKQARNCIER